MKVNSFYESKGKFCKKTYFDFTRGGGRSKYDLTLATTFLKVPH